MKKLQDYLLQLGLSELEAKLYEGLLELGPTTVQYLSNHVGVKRITTHFNVESLIQKGLVTETRSGTRRQIIAEQPERLGYLVEQKIESAKKLQEKLPDILDTIQTALPESKASGSVEIKYYKGKQSVKLIYDESLKAKEFRAYVNCKQLSMVFPVNVDLFVKTHKERKEMRIWEIMEQSPESFDYANKMPKERYLCKFVPNGMNLSVIDYMMFDGKVAIVDLKEETSGMVIDNFNYYTSAKAIFEFVWQMLPDYKV